MTDETPDKTNNQPPDQRHGKGPGVHKMRAQSVTSQVMDLLTEAEDFVAMRDILRHFPPGEQSYCRVSAALSHLRKHGAVDFLAQDGVTYWFATPASDDRMSTRENWVGDYKKPNARRRIIKKEPKPQ